MVVVVVVLVGVREHVLTGRTVNIFVTPEVTLAVSGETLKETTEDGASPRRGTGGRLKDGESRTGMEDKVIGGGRGVGGGAAVGGGGGWGVLVVAHAGSKIIVSGSHYAHIV